MQPSSVYMSTPTPALTSSRAIFASLELKKTIIGQMEEYPRIGQSNQNLIPLVPG